MALTDKQSMFVKEYLIDLNATQAAIRAGYSPKSAMEQGYQLLQKTSVQEEIQIQMNNRSKRTEITADKVLKELAKLGFSDMRDFASWDSGGVNLMQSTDIEDTACVSEVSQSATAFGTNVKIKFHDKKGALELLGKHLGIFVEKLEVSGNMNNNVNISGLSLEELRRLAKSKSSPA